VKTKRFVGSFVNVIFTRQTCGQRSSRAAESKRRALGNYYPVRICYMFLMSKCKGDWDLGRCTFWVFAKRETLHHAKFRFFLRSKQVFLTRRHFAAVLSSQIPKKCADLGLSDGLLCSLTLWTFSKFARENKFLALGVCFPQPCSFFVFYCYTASAPITQWTHTSEGALMG